MRIALATVGTTGDVAQFAVMARALVATSPRSPARCTELREGLGD